jgi:hypothetical protein
MQEISPGAPSLSWRPWSGQGAADRHTGAANQDTGGPAGKKDRGCIGVMNNATGTTVGRGRLRKSLGKR